MLSFLAIFLHLMFPSPHRLLKPQPDEAAGAVQSEHAARLANFCETSTGANSGRLISFVILIKYLKLRCRREAGDNAKAGRLGPLGSDAGDESQSPVEHHMTLPINRTM